MERREEHRLEQGGKTVPTIAAARERMVNRHLIPRGITHERVLEAMRRVPRERFVPVDLEEFAYDDAPIPIAQGQTISQPFMVATMIQAAELEPSDRVLEVGAGSGYGAAILGQVASHVWTIERHAQLAGEARALLAELGYTNIEVVHGDGTLGLPAHAPFDAIVVTAGGPTIPPPLIEQLVVGGRLVLPVGPPGVQELVRVRRTSTGSDRETLAQVRFVPLVSDAGH